MQGEDFQFEMIKTADGSPSVRLWKSQQPPEAMHHLSGAFSETLYIYGSAVKSSLELESNLNVLSVGLGLGYNEILSAGIALSANAPLQMRSFESENLLRNNFINWLRDDHSPEPWKGIYETILGLVSQEVGLLPDHLKNYLLESLDNGNWTLDKTLDAHTDFPQTFNCILFDAFSSGATPSLWTEDFLNSFLRKAAADTCIFSTYAATGALRRSLQNSGFNVEMRPGFSGKRQSTWAQKKQK